MQYKTQCRGNTCYYQKFLKLFRNPTKVLNKTTGVKQATVNLTTEQATIDYYPGQTDVDTLIGRIQHLGYDAKPKQSKKEQASQENTPRTSKQEYFDNFWRVASPK